MATHLNLVCDPLVSPHPRFGTHCSKAYVRFLEMACISSTFRDYHVFCSKWPILPNFTCADEAVPNGAYAVSHGECFRPQRSPPAMEKKIPCPVVSLCCLPRSTWVCPSCAEWIQTCGLRLEKGNEYQQCSLPVLSLPCGALLSAPSFSSFCPLSMLSDLPCRV